MRITSGIRVGWWTQKGFDPVGFYIGPDLGDHIPGTHLEQELMEGTLGFNVGVLFRPDLGRRQRLETILILENYIPEMFEYNDWSLACSVG